MDRSISIVPQKNLCLGCAACSAVCPSNAISMIQTSEGYVPRVDKLKCINCGICKSACPSLNFNIDNDCIKKDFKYYVAKSTDKSIYNNASSGGVVSSLLISLLQSKRIDGAFLVKNDKIVPYPFIARTKEDILSCSGSKYCPVPMFSNLRQIIDSDLKSIAFVGLPCQVQALKNISKFNPKLQKKNIIYLGLFCSRMPTLRATNYLVERILKTKIDNVNEFIYRKGHFAELIQKDGVTKKIHYKKYWNSQFKYLINYRCLFCYDRLNELADISFGDYWDGKQNIVIIRNNNYINDFIKSAIINSHELEFEAAKKYLSKGVRFKKNLLEAKIKILNESILRRDGVIKSRWKDYLYSMAFILKYKIINLIDSLFECKTKSLTQTVGKDSPK